MTVTVCAATGAKRLQPANIARIAFFFAYLGGFDTHDLELNDQGTGLAQVRQALNAFYNSTVEMSVSQKCGDVHGIRFRAYAAAERRRDSGDSLSHSGELRRVAAAYFPVDLQAHFTSCLQVFNPPPVKT